MTNNTFKQTEIGEIPEDWDIALLSEVAKVNEASVNKDFKYEWVEYIDVSSTLKGEILETQKLSLKDAPSRAKRIVSDNDILISTVRPNLKHFAFVSKTKPNLIASTGYAVVSSKKVNPRFLYYYLTTEEYTNYLSAIADTTTSTYPAFNPDVLERSRIPFPSENEQKQIASILSSLDDKIELNRRMNKTLEEIGKALFKQWFVDFEFPNENGEPYKSSGGEMVESELGEIPRGWKVEPVGNYLTILDSKRIPLSSRERSKRQGEYRYYGATGVVDYVDDFLFDGVYLLLGEDGTVTVDDGYPYTQYVWGQFWVNNHAHVLLGEKQFSTEYLKLFFDSTIISSYVTGAVQPKLNQTNLRSIPIVVPEKDLALNFDEFILPLFAHIRKNEDEIQSLISARDSLLPRLMSGKIRVD